LFVYSQDLKPRDSNTLSHRPSASLLRMAEIHGRGWGKAQRSRVVLSRSVLLWRCLLWLLLLSPFFGINHCRIIVVITMNVFSVSRCPFYLLLSSSFTYNHVYIYIHYVIFWNLIMVVIVVPVPLRRKQNPRSQRSQRSRLNRAGNVQNATSPTKRNAPLGLSWPMASGGIARDSKWKRKSATGKRRWESHRIREHVCHILPLFA
jgi:hypothetical protein